MSLSPPSRPGPRARVLSPQPQPPTARGRQRRSEVFQIRAREVEDAAWKARAAAIGLSQSEWARALLNADAFATTDEAIAAGAELAPLPADARPGTYADGLRRGRKQMRLRLRYRVLAALTRLGLTDAERIAEAKLILRDTER